LRKSGKKIDIKTAEIWENNAEFWQLISEFWQLIDFSQFAEIWDNVAELWCFPNIIMKKEGAKGFLNEPSDVQWTIVIRRKLGNTHAKKQTLEDII
jgi:hypothetical protein